jgi:hypothetical protein
MLLAGHNHRASVQDARDLVTRAGSALVVQAGTATSIRLRDEEQSFNRIEIDGDRVTVTIERWTGDAYAPADAQRFVREGDSWRIGKHIAEPAS